MNRYVEFNPNPECKQTGDCTVRAICAATGQSWEAVYLWLALYGLMYADEPTANYVWGAYLRRNGYTRHLVDDGNRDGYTVYDFAADHPDGVYILGTGTHVVTVRDGKYYDAWNSGGEKPIYFYTKE